MKQLHEPKVECTPRPGAWPVFFIALGIYFASYFLADVVLLATSFENWSDFGFMIRHAGEPLIKGVFPALLSLICPLGLTFLFVPITFQSRRNLFIVLVTPLLLISGLMVYSVITHSSTSKGRLAQQRTVTLPANHSRYLAYHPLGASMLVRIGAGTRDYYSFHLDPASMETFLSNYHPSEQHKLQLQSRIERHADLPPEIAHDLHSPDLVVYPAGWDADIVTHPPSSRVLVICYNPPH